jgi:hypothetical protein
MQVLSTPAVNDKIQDTCKAGIVQNNEKAVFFSDEYKGEPFPAADPAMLEISKMHWKPVVYADPDLSQSDLDLIAQLDSFGRKQTRKVYAQRNKDREKDSFLDTQMIKETIAETKRLSPEDFADDLYLQLVKPKDKPEGRFFISTVIYPENTLFLSDYASFSKTGHYLPSLAVLNQKMEFPALYNKNKEVSLAVNPWLIHTSKEPLMQAKGRVAVLGDTTGYFAFSAAAKPEVSSVIVYALNPALASVLKEDVFAYHPHKEKIKIRNLDLNGFLKTVKNGQFDFCYFDTPAESYLRFLDIAKKMKRLDKTEYRIGQDLDYALLLRNDVIKYLTFHLDNSLLNFAKKMAGEQAIAVCEKVKIRKPKDIDKLVDIENLRDSMYKV